MPAANMKLDQVGLSPGVAGKSRLDGKADGSLVTLTSATPGTSNTFELLYVPPDDDEAIDSLAPTGGGATPIWTFSPKAGVRGPYLVELTVNGTLVEHRVFGVPGWRHGLVAPALNERGDTTARSGLSGVALAAALARTDRNVDSLGTASVDGWQRSLLDMAAAIDVGNYAQMVVPPNAVCEVPAGQRMFFRGDLAGDFQGDFEEIGSEIPPLFAGQVLGKAWNAIDDGSVQALDGSQLRYLAFAWQPGGSSVAIGVESGGGSPDLQSGTTVHDWGSGSEIWRTGYVFEIISTRLGGSSVPCTITGFDRDEISNAGNVSGIYTRPPGPRFCFLKWLRLNALGCPLLLKHDHSGSAVGNRIHTPDGQDYYVAPGTTFALVASSYLDHHWLVVGPPSPPPWGDLIEVAGTTVLKAGPVNRFRNDVVAGITLEMPNPGDGIDNGAEVRIKEVGGIGGFEVTIFSPASSIEGPDSVINITAVLDAGAHGVSLHYKYDMDFTTWRLISYLQPPSS